MNNKFIAGGWGPVPEEILKIYPKINVSGLKQINVSPVYYESCSILKEVEQTKAMNLGTKLHYAILEPDKFDDLFVLEPSDDLIPDHVIQTADQLKEFCRSEGLKISGTKLDLFDRLKDHGVQIELYETWIEKYLAGREILKQKEAHAAKRIIGRIKENKNLESILQGGETEKLAWVIHERTKTIVSFRPDKYKELTKPVHGLHQYAIDLKTMNTLTTESDLQKFVANDDTHLQLAFYVDALEFLTKKPTAAVIFGVETTPPYTTMFKIIGGASLETGRADYEKCLDTFSECVLNNKYPTGQELIGTIDLPAWKLAQIENRESKYLD